MPTMSPRVRMVAGHVAAVLSAVVVIAVTGAIMAWGVVNPAPQVQQVDTEPVDIGAGPLTLVCPDAPRPATSGAGSDIDYDAEFAPEAAESATHTRVLVSGRGGQEPGAVEYAVLGEDAGEVPIAGAVAVGSYEGTEEPAVVTAQPRLDSTPLGAATMVARSDSGDIRGLSAAPCLPANATLWLVGGATEPGSSARLALTNPGATVVRATVELWGETGPVEESTEVLIAPGEAETVLLETLAVQERLAVRITADGGRVGATIQASGMHGVVPAGTDIVTAAADPATEITLGPVQTSQEEMDEQAPVLRLVNPDQDEAVVSVDLLTEEGSQPLPGAQEQILDPGTVTDISLSGLDAGVIAARVTSDAPVTGSLLRTVIGQAGELDPAEPVVDRAWLAAQRPVPHGMLALPEELVDSAVVVLANPLQQAQQVHLEPISASGSHGDPVTLQIEAGAAVAVDPADLEGAAAVRLDAEAVLASVMVRADAGDGPLLSMLPLTPDAQEDQQVRVRLNSS